MGIPSGARKDWALNGWSAFLSVESVEHTLPELQKLIGCESDGGHSLGDQKVSRVGTDGQNEWSNSEWRYDIESSHEDSFGVQGLPEALISLDDSLVQNIVSLGNSCVVTLTVIQYLDDLDLLGIYLDPAAMAVLASLQAHLSIDQYRD